MDLACGDKAGNVFAGLLLRAVIDPLDKLIEGPCLVVDKILELNGFLERFQENSILFPVFSDVFSMPLYNWLADAARNIGSDTIEFTWNNILD